MKKRLTYTREFKLEAIRLVEASNRPVSELARKLCIRRNQLYKWKEQFEQKGDTAFPGRGRRAASMDEITLLKLELEQLREENTILKKAVTYFARAAE